MLSSNKYLTKVVYRLFDYFFALPHIGDPSESTKLDRLKLFLGGAEDEFETTPETAEDAEMAIKLEKDDLESIMARAIESAMAARENATTQSSASSAQGGEVNAIAAANPLKIAGFWEDDPHT